MYRALKPRYIKTGEVTHYDGEAIKWHRVEWQELGPAQNMADAKRRYGGRPVLEWVQINEKPWTRGNHHDQKDQRQGQAAAEVLRG